MTKRCSSCGMYKPRASFYRCRANINGRHSQCKECHRRYSRSESGKAAFKKSTTKYRKANPHRKKAWNTLNRGIERGIINRPNNCMICGSIKKLQAHHEDYDKPLEVAWLCVKCHKDTHTKRGPTRPLQTNKSMGV